MGTNKRIFTPDDLVIVWQGRRNFWSKPTTIGFWLGKQDRRHWVRIRSDESSLSISEDRAIRLMAMYTNGDAPKEAW